MRSMLLLGASLASASPSFASGPVEGRYAAYVGGLNVLNLNASFELVAPTYRVAVTFETAGILSNFVAGRQVSWVEGVLEPQGDARLRPSVYRSEGVWRGSARLTAIDYRSAPPRIELDPPNTGEREPVPPAMQEGTADALTALALLLDNVTRTGRCEGSAKLFDGRRRTDLVARTDGPDTLVRNRISVYAGPTLRCSFEGRQVAGFWSGRTREEQAQPRTGTVWFAQPASGAPMMPVRIEADTGFFGRGIVHLTGFGPAPQGATPAALR